MFDPGAGAGAEWLRYDWSDHVNQQQYKASHRPPWDQIIIITFSQLSHISPRTVKNINLGQSQT